jgi:NAD(P)-dependent dehydrogenase (short-subunit alcohol dehydrogenase family)
MANSTADSGGGGPVAIVTGASTGIGYHTARGLALKGYTVVLATRSAQAGAAAAERITRDAAAAAASESRSFLEGASVHTGRAVCLPLDVASLASVRAFAEGLPPALAARLHVLVLNAGISGLGLAREERLTGDDLERVFATNFVGHFYLAQLLLEPLKLTASGAPIGAPPVRIVTLASVTHRLVPAAPPSWPAVLAGTAPRGHQYAYSKLAALLFAGELNRTVLAGSGVAAVAVNPGAVNSDIWRAIRPLTACWFRPLMRLTFLTPAQGAATSLAAATEREVGGCALEAQGGARAATLYLSPYAASSWAQRWGGWAAVLGDLIGPFGGPQVQLPTPLALDAKCARELWATCESAIARKQGL